VARRARFSRVAARQLAMREPGFAAGRLTGGAAFFQNPL